MGRSVMIYNWPNVGLGVGGGGGISTSIDINESIYRLIGFPYCFRPKLKPPFLCLLY